MILIALSTLPLLLETLWKGPSQIPDPKQPPESIDTLIPTGSVLIPIEVENSESLDSILGHKGIVDLHRPAREPGSKNRIVAKRLPILRAPLNPQQFAVLAPEEQAQVIVREPGPFWVVVQNPSRFGTQFERVRNKSPHRRIIVDGGVE
ncbi:MAG: hypothetical protein KDD43_02770 [Bdellovibrionales bacterium]|nr:hypothetical protein [Bdellovibrionales bacterium]